MLQCITDYLSFKACLFYQYGNINPCYHCKYIVLIMIMLQQREGRPAPLPSLMIPFKIPLLVPLSPFLSNEVHLFFTFPARPLWIFPLLPQWHLQCRLALTHQKKISTVHKKSRNNICHDLIHPMLNTELLYKLASRNKILC